MAKPANRGYKSARLQTHRVGDMATGMSRAYSQMQDQMHQERKAPRTFKDVEWIGVFLLHLVGVVVLGCVYTLDFGSRQSHTAQSILGHPFSAK
jgi:hypothetical protein